MIKRSGMESKMLKKTLLILMCIMVWMMTACGEQGQKESQKPIQTPFSQKIETATIYSINMDTMSLMPVHIRKDKTDTMSPQQIVDLVVDNLNEKIKVESVTISNHIVVVSFEPDSVPLKGCTKKVERLTLECIANSLIDNAKGCQKVVFRSGGKAYKSKHLSLSLNEVFASE